MRVGSAWKPAAIVVCFAAADASAAIVIDHSPVSCVVAAQFPRFEARFDPSADVSRARLHFRPEGGPHWYSVGMKPEGEVFAGVLPKPRASLSRIEYYIEVTDTAFGSSRTSEFTPGVASGPLACKDEVAAGALPSATVLIEAPAGAPLVPTGFDPQGVVAASAGTAGAQAAGTSTTAASGASATAAGGGGLSTTALVVGGAVVAGAGVAVAVAGGGSDDGSASGVGGSGGSGGSAGGGGATCTPAPVTARLANQVPAQRCGQSFAADVIVTNGSCSTLTIQSIQLTQDAIAGTFCSGILMQTTYPAAVTTIAAGQTATISNFRSGVFCCNPAPCPGATVCTYNETFAVQSSAGPLPAGSMTLQVSFDPTCAPCP